MSKRQRITQFGVFEANLVARELRRGGLRVKLQDQPFEVLAALGEIRHKGRAPEANLERRHLGGDE